MAQKQLSKRKKVVNQQYMTQFSYAAPKDNQPPNQNNFKRIGIYHDNGPIVTAGGAFMVEFDWYNHSDTYEEDIFSLLRLNKLPEVHKYVMNTYRTWSRQFIIALQATTLIENDLRYRIGDILSQQNKYYEVIQVATGDALLYLPNYQDTLQLYTCTQINVSKSIEREKIKYKHNTQYVLSNYESEPITFITRSKKRAVIYFLKKETSNAYNDGWAVCFFNSKRDLKASKQSEIYNHSFKASKWMLQRLYDLNKHIITTNKTQRTFTMNYESSANVFGGDYFSRESDGNTYHVGRDMQITFSINGKKISVSGLILRKDSLGNVYGDS
eukprot:318314_1